MEGNEKIMVYPYDMEFSPLLRHKEMLGASNSFILISPAGYGFDGCDASIADGGSNLGMKVSDDFDKNLEACDTVWFMETDCTQDIMSLLHKKIEIAAGKGKNIICSVELEQSLLDNVSRICASNSRYLKYINTKHLRRKSISVEMEREYLVKIDVPVILVIGTYEKSQKFQIQLDLRRKLAGSGYRISQVGSRSYCEMLGFHSFPEFMFNSSLDESKKVVLFNHFIKKVEIEEKPDVIIVGVPGGILPFDSEFTNRFGITAYEISHAIIPDAVVLCSLYEDYAPEYFDKVAETLSGRFGFETDCFCISNQRFDWSEARDMKKNLFISVDSHKIDKMIAEFSDLKFPLFNAISDQSAEKMAEFIVGRLSDYGDTEALCGGI